MKEERKNERKEENQTIWDFQPIKELLDGNGLEHSEGTSSDAQCRSQLSQL